MIKKNIWELGYKKSFRLCLITFTPKVAQLSAREINEEGEREVNRGITKR